MNLENFAWYCFQVSHSWSLDCPGIVSNGCRILILEPQVLLLIKGKLPSKTLIVPKRCVREKNREITPSLIVVILCMATTLNTFDEWCLQVFEQDCCCLVAFKYGFYTVSISSDYLCAWWGWCSVHQQIFAEELHRKLWAVMHAFLLLTLCNRALLLWGKGNLYPQVPAITHTCQKPGRKVPEIFVLSFLSRVES